MTKQSIGDPNKSQDVDVVSVENFAVMPTHDDTLTAVQRTIL
jgi:hypothetical protein